MHFQLVAIRPENRFLQLPTRFSSSRQHTTTFSCRSLAYKPSKAALYRSCIVTYDVYIAHAISADAQTSRRGKRKAILRRTSRSRAAHAPAGKTVHLIFCSYLSTSGRRMFFSTVPKVCSYMYFSALNVCLDTIFRKSSCNQQCCELCIVLVGISILYLCI